MRIHPSSINNQLMVAEPPQGSSGECPIILFEEITRGEAQLYVRQCTLATAHALLLVAVSGARDLLQTAPQVTCPLVVRLQAHAPLWVHGRVAGWHSLTTSVTLLAAGASSQPCERSDRDDAGH